jgi:hypothetical protein
MQARNAGLLTGMLFLALCGPLAAHPSGGGYGYPAEGSGSVTVWGGSYGPGGWSGSLSFGSPYAYAPAYIPWAALPGGHRHVAQCSHGPRHAYGKAYRKGYAHGRHERYAYGDEERHGHGRGHDRDD